MLNLNTQNGRRTTVPIHPGKDIGKKTLKGVLQDLDLTIEEVIKILKKINPSK